MSGGAARLPRVAGEYRIGRYRVRARLGKGGMGVVYLGRDEALDRDVAIKTLRLEGSPDDESRGRFEIEAKAAARLQHPNIVTVFELGEDRGLPFIAMELLGGQDLEALLRSGENLSTSERLDIVIQTLRGLDFAHNHQIVHRDIKPSNIRVLDDGGVKILDFGIAKVESTGVTRAGMMVGTPYYMSPEHIRSGVLDGRTDVFAVGVILHELFAFKRPFMADDPTRVLYRIVNEPHPRLPEDAAGQLTADVQRVIDKSLEKEADARYATAGAMADDLAAVRGQYQPPQLSADDLLALSQARKRLTGSLADSTTIETVEAIALKNPDATEAQRLRRLLHRKPNEGGSLTETGTFPELDATFGRAEDGGAALSGQTVNGRAETILQGGSLPVGATGSLPAPPHSNALIYGAIASVVITGSLAGLVYLNRGGGNPEPAKPTPTITEIFVPGAEAVPEKPAPGKAPDPVRPPAVVPMAPLEIRSTPAGASIRLDRKTIGVTPFKTAVSADATHAITLSLAGYVTRDVRVDLPIPATVEATLAPTGPPGTLVVESPYPLTVSVGGRVLSSDKPGGTLTLPAGSHDVLLESASLFLKHHETVQLDGGGSVTIKAPAAGKIGVRATPDNCKVFVNGVFVDYPPILDRTIAAGNYVVSFEWPDGARSEEKVQIQAGKPSYVMGRKP